MSLYYTYETPVGELTFFEKNGFLVGIVAGRVAGEGKLGETSVLREAYTQVNAYLKGQRQAFSLPFLFYGTPFSEAVWRALMEIPYGETRTYKQVAEAIGKSTACRAVGRAIHTNPLLIVIPCHRVVGSDRSLTGYAGGLEMKRKLLDLESCFKHSFDV